MLLLKVQKHSCYSQHDVEAREGGHRDQGLVIRYVSPGDVMDDLAATARATVYVNVEERS